MTADNTTKAIRTVWVDLPSAIRTYLAAHRVRDAATAITTFTADAEVTDEGRTYRGRDEIVAWLGAAASEYTFTTDFTDATVTGGAYADVAQHLEGDFPGGVADLHFRFTLDGGLISRLIIEP
ncbi:nuclear transport factor 2 family protein [Mycolicibacterium baixiangningiae]|uniref:nuclear transport factor 2 family protein n=1 Tax=Mycolicibacterium baixiangningiae TaxID=2761578 RepID=UPI0018CFF022|nr:nuclear transport factor 2 family protein [Mycolicibacterium baixiangningiae]